MVDGRALPEICELWMMECDNAKDRNRNLGQGSSQGIRVFEEMMFEEMMSRGKTQRAWVSGVRRLLRAIHCLSGLCNFFTALDQNAELARPSLFICRVKYCA